MIDPNGLPNSASDPIHMKKRQYSDLSTAADYYRKDESSDYSGSESTCSSLSPSSSLSSLAGPRNPPKKKQATDKSGGSRKSRLASFNLECKAAKKLKGSGGEGVARGVTKGGKSKRSNVAHGGGVEVCEPRQRVTANKKERRRTQSINNAFAELRNRIPQIPQDTKLSKIKTLKLATDYIEYLMKV